MPQSSDEDRSYRVELMASRDLLSEIFGDDYSHTQCSLLLNLVRDEVTGDITPMKGQMAYLGRKPGEYISLGLLAVGDVTTLLNLIDFTDSSNGINPGMTRADNGDSVYIEEDIDEELAEKKGGSILRSEDKTTIFQMSTNEVIEFNKERGVYDSSESLSAGAGQKSLVSIVRDDISERIQDRAEAVDDQLEDIPDSHVMPDPEDMTIGSAKHFSLGIVFVDIAGFSEYAQRNADKDTLLMLNLLIPEIMEMIRDNGGDFEKNTGDGILAYFGAGESDRDTASLILKYMVMIRTALRDYMNPILKDYDVETVGIKAGAAMGDVHISRIGVNRLNRRTVVGEAANIASELEEMADEDEFFVSGNILEEAHEVNDDLTSLFRRRGVLSEFEQDGDEVEYYNFGGYLDESD